MPSLFARKALLARGWTERVRLQIDGGRIAAIETGTRARSGDVAAGIVIPGLTNAHSHAFQRALVGRTEQRSPADGDNFRSWRSRMYELAERVDADSLTAIARQTYTEMLCRGYTGVAEFHYLHRETATARPNGSMLRALIQAAADSGIRLTYVPVLYERAGFDRPEPEAAQRRFTMTLEAFENHYRHAQEIAAGRFTVGIGAHSLRAVSTASLERVAALAQADRAPMHLHIAEQQREVDDCVAARGARPVRWLTERFDIGERWCLVHATHMDDDEAGAVAGSGAVVCLCPSTEGNLGDGFFPLSKYLSGGGRIAIGSDSHVTIDPFEELRWLEYGQRLLAQRRNIAAAGERHTGHHLFELAAAGGALACGGRGGRLEKEADADLLLLDEDSPMLAGHSSATLLDALIFSGLPLPIERVMVRGAWRVIDGRHVDGERAQSEYARVVRTLYPEQAKFT